MKSRGFRFSPLDGAFLILAALGTGLLYPVTPTYTWLVPFTVGHFFLFCNVIRMRRSYELIWAALFLVNFGALAFVFPPFSWPRMLLPQLPITAVFSWLTIRSPHYRGVGCQRIATGRTDS